MRVGRKIFLVGGVPTLIAVAITLGAWLLLAQEERARGGAVLAGQVYRTLTVARMVRDDYVTARAPDRAKPAERFAILTSEARAGLNDLKRFARTADQAERIASAQEALSRYVARMRDFAGVTRENDGLIAEMGARAGTLIVLAEQARLRQQASNADLVRSLGDKVNKLRITRDVIAGINALRAITAEIALEKARNGVPIFTIQSQAFRSGVVRLRNASRALAASLRADGREREADELAVLTATDETVRTGTTRVAEAADATADLTAESGLSEADTAAHSGLGLTDWGERILKIDSSGQRTLHEEVSQLLTYSIQANETEQATQNIAITTLKLGQRTADALLRRDPVAAGTMLEEGEQLSATAAALPISPLIQAEMIAAIDDWHGRLTTTIGGIRRQNEMLADMDGLATAMIESARGLDDAFIGDADRFGAFVRQILLGGSAAGLLIGTLVALVVARAITGPLRQLQGDMIVLAANPTGGEISGTRRGDELGDIARATNFFVTEIARRERALRRAKDQADAALLELHQAQADLIRAEKLASLGQLVAGVAHEINTPLGIALTTATLVRDETRAFQGVVGSGTLSRSRLTHFVDRVEEGTHLLCSNLARAADLVHGFKQVAVDRVSDERRSFELGTWLDELLASLQPLLRKGGHRITSACPPGLVVDTNPGALAQVATNLITNAVVHGFDRGQHGHIAVRVSPAATGFVRLEIADDGRGIPPENINRIFDPFFTTARSRGSTGLGMHIVHNLVTAKLQGRIAIESAPGQGTVVAVEFPVGAYGPERPALASLPA